VRGQNSYEEFNRTVRSSSRFRASSKVGRVSAQRRRFVLQFRRLASLAVWLDQEEELVAEEFKELLAPSKSS
jgi:hypothetical protein